MSKTEAVRAMNDSMPQLEILRTLREISSQGQSLSQELAPLSTSLREQADRMLAQTSDLSTDMKSLPQALASEVAPMLAELERLASMLDTNMEAQRSTFSAIASASAEQWKAQLQEAQALNRELRERLTALESRDELSVKAARAMIAVPKQIEAKVEDHARIMTEAVDQWRRLEEGRKPWKTVLASAVLAALLAVSLHPLGTLVSEKLRSSELETDALAMRQLWEKATPGERDLMTGILKRQR